MILQAVQTDLRAFLKPVAAAYDSLAQSKEISFDFEMEENISLYLDPEKMEKILHNILSNAFKFTEKGGRISITAGVCDSKGKQRARISITDTGIGIAAHELARIFDRFYQAGSSHSRKYKGTGIGLALTKELVTLHHGEIDVTSASGKGASFTILLPLGKAHLSQDEIAVQAKPGTPPGVAVPAAASIQEGETVHLRPAPAAATSPKDAVPALPQLLIVEDNTDMQAFLLQILQPHYRVTVTSNGLEGLERAKEQQPDLELSDVMMPEMDGDRKSTRLNSIH